MCLVVNSKKLVAKTDLVVYKILKKYNNFLTLFRDFPIKFINGETYLVMADKELYGLKPFYNEIHEGIHAYYDKKKADLISTGFQRTKHYAIIPKGCEYYLGTKGDIVSTEMIIFETKKDYLKYKQMHKVKPVAKLTCIFQKFYLSLCKIFV